MSLIYNEFEKKLHIKSQSQYWLKKKPTVYILKQLEGINTEISKNVARNKIHYLKEQFTQKCQFYHHSHTFWSSKATESFSPSSSNCKDQAKLSFCVMK